MQRDTQGWRNQVWISFAIAVTSCVIGVVQVGNLRDTNFH